MRLGREVWLARFGATILCAYVDVSPMEAGGPYSRGGTGAPSCGAVRILLRRISRELINVENGASCKFVCLGRSNKTQEGENTHPTATFEGAGQARSGLTTSIESSYGDLPRTGHTLAVVSFSYYYYYLGVKLASTTRVRSH